MSRCRALVFPLMILLTRTAEAVNVDDVLNKYVDALGGAAALRAVTSRVMKGTITVPAGAKGSIAIFAKAPNKLLTVTSITGLGESREGYDGTTAWALDDDGKAREVQAFAKREADFYFAMNMHAAYP